MAGRPIGVYHPCVGADCEAHFPWHWLPGGQARFVVCVVLVVLVWWGWLSLTSDIRAQRRRDDG